jgi:hypothetical protein
MARPQFSTSFQSGIQLDFNATILIDYFTVRSYWLNGGADSKRWGIPIKEGFE